MTTSRIVEIKMAIVESETVLNELVDIKAKLNAAIALEIAVEPMEYSIITTMIAQLTELIEQAKTLLDKELQDADEYIGMACRTEFYVKRGGKYWHYYAKIEHPGEIESEPFDQTVTPSKAHFHQWVITSLK